MAKKNEKTKKKNINPSFFKDDRVKIITGAFILVASIYLFFSILSYFFTWQVDQSKLDISFFELFKDRNIDVENWTGKLGAFLAHVFVHNWFGIASLSFVFLFGLVGLRMLGLKFLSIKKTSKHLIIITFWLSVALGYLFQKSTFLPGGAHGYFLSNWLNAFAGKIGTAFLLLVTLFAILIFTFDGLLEKIKQSIKKLFQKTEDIALKKAFVEKEDSIQNEKKEEKDLSETTPSADANKKEKDNKGISFEIMNLNEEKEEVKKAEEEIKTISETNDFDNLTTVEIKTVENNTEEEHKTEEKKLEFSILNKDDDDDLAEEIGTEPLKDYDPTLDLSDYKLPSIELLAEHDAKNTSVTNEELNENKDKIVETLANYKIEITDIKAIVGPTITLYEIVPAPGVRISKIKNLEDDIALSLAALGIRIIAPIPGKGTIGIEVPNLKPRIVSMRSIIASKTFQDSKHELPVALGKTIANETYVIDLAKMPHMLVAGATGQGKSVGLNAILTSLLYKKHPAQLKMVLVDPKKVELTLYQKIEKHFLAMLPDAEEAIITDTQKVVNTLNSLCIEMDARYDLLKSAQVRNIKEYNAKFTARRLNPEKGHQFLPYIVVVIDEFADLIMTAGKEVELPIARLAQLARAIGIHLIIATQRPTTNIITGLIKANFPARIAFRVTSMMDSRTILDSPGANQLIGRGDMLISQGSEMVRLQCAFVDTPELEGITNFIGSQQGYPIVYELPEYVDENSNEIGEVDLTKRDNMFDDAARLIVANQQGSTSLIQRKFSIGYNRAGRIVDQLEAAGIVGPFEGSKARQVLIADELSLEQLLKGLP